MVEERDEARQADVSSAYGFESHVWYHRRGAVIGAGPTALGGHGAMGLVGVPSSKLEFR